MGASHRAGRGKGTGSRKRFSAGSRGEAVPLIHGPFLFSGGGVPARGERICTSAHFANFSTVGPAAQSCLLDPFCTGLETTTPTVLFACQLSFKKYGLCLHLYVPVVFAMSVFCSRLCSRALLDQFRWANFAFWVFWPRVLLAPAPRKRNRTSEDIGGHRRGDPGMVLGLLFLHLDSFKMLQPSAASFCAIWPFPHRLIRLRLPSFLSTHLWT